MVWGNASKGTLTRSLVESVVLRLQEHQKTSGFQGAKVFHSSAESRGTQARHVPHTAPGVPLAWGPLPAPQGGYSLRYGL